MVFPLSSENMYKKKENSGIEKEVRELFSHKQTLRTTKTRISICEDLQDNENQERNSENSEPVLNFQILFRDISQ